MAFFSLPLNTYKNVLVDKQQKGIALTPDETGFLQSLDNPNSRLFGHENEQLYLLMGLAALMSPRGREVYKTLEPLLFQLLDMLKTALGYMFQASTAQPALTIPATLLFTSVSENLMLIDHRTAQQVFTITSALATIEGILGVFKSGIQAIGFSAPSSSILGRVIGSSAGTALTQVAKGEAAHTRGTT